MCLAFPGRVVQINGDFATVDFGANTMRDNINVAQVEVREGDYVLVHAGSAIQVLDLAQANNILRYWQENISWKCERCSIAKECPLGSMILEIGSKNASKIAWGRCSK